MAQNSEVRLVPVAIFSSDSVFRREAVSRLQGAARYRVAEYEAEAFLAGPPEEARPQLIVFDVGGGAILDDATLGQARQKWGAIPVILVSGELAPHQVRLFLRLNPADWLRKPVSGRDLLATVSQHHGDARDSHSTIWTFIGANGGVGGTTMALHAAWDIAQQKDVEPGEVAVLDLDFTKGDCGGYIGRHNEFDLSSVLRDPDRLDVELLDLIKAESPQGFSLFSFEQPGIVFSTTLPDFVFKLLDLTAFHYRHLVIDMPNMWTPWFDAVIANSDRLCIVAEMNLASLRHAKKLHGKIKEMRGNGANITLALNNHKRKLFGNMLSRKEVQRVFTSGRIHFVARDDALMKEAMNRAELAAEINRSSRAIKDAKKVFASLRPAK
jgi:pilus assembly protein CpaE